MLENDFLLTEEEKKLREETKEFVKIIDPELLKKMDEDAIDYPYDFYREAGRRNLLGLRFPKKYGGRGLPWTAEGIALEEIAVFGNGLGCSYAMPSIVGEGVNTFGTEEQKEKYLVPLIKGEKVSAEGLTEPRGGSDFFGTTTKAEKKGDVYVLNGEKRFIAGGAVADFYLLYARTDPNVPGHKGLSAFIVERDRGVKTAKRYGLLGFRGMGTARIVLNDLEVPEENLLGGPEGLNRGGLVFNRMMIPERFTSAASSIGSARAALEVAMKYSDRRKAFGQKIRAFEGVNFKVAESVAKLDAACALIYAAARAIDSGEDARKIVSEAKYYATEVAWDVTNDAMQILGGIGYTTIFPVERILRDARLNTIWTGSNEVMKMLVQHEAYKKLLSGEYKDRDIELDVGDLDREEIVYE